MLDQKALESRIRHIELQSRKTVEEMLAGEYRSGFKGMGVEFEDVRAYQHGDDVRAIDWNVTARTGKPHVKTFMEERELSLYFLVDISGSSDFGSGEQSKRDVMVRVVALLAFAAAHNHDNVGLILFGNGLEVHLPARKGKNHVMRMIELMMTHKAERAGTDIAGALEAFRQLRRRRCVVFLFSDFLAENYEEELKAAAHLYDVCCVSVCDERESELPDCGMIELRDAETGAVQMVDCRDAAVRDALAVWSSDRQQELRDLCHEANVDLLELGAGEDYLHKIIRFLRERNKRSADA